jgi:peptide deformylase
MSKREIISLPDPVLRRKAHKVEKVDDSIKELIEDMIETMRAAPGVGLAATQVGISQRVIVVEFGKEDDEEAPKKLFVLVNPEITFSDKEQVNGVEACLSVPGLVGEVDRYTKALVKGLNAHGHPVKIKAQGWLARIFQHEIDHLDGIVYTDRATRVWVPQKEDESAIEKQT